jgi:hypothetical protein
MDTPSGVREFNFLTSGTIIPFLELPYICLKARMYRLYYKAKLGGEQNYAAPRMLHPSVLNERWWINFFYRDFDFSHYHRGIKEYRSHVELRHFFNEHNPYSEVVLRNLDLNEKIEALPEGKGFIIHAANFVVEEGYVSIKFHKGSKLVDWPVKFWNTKDAEVLLKPLRDFNRTDGWADVINHLFNRQHTLPKESGDSLKIHLSPYFAIKAIERVSAS